MVKSCATDDDCDCGVCVQDKPGYAKGCAPRMSVCVFQGQGGAQGATGGYYGGGGGVTGTGGVKDSGMGGAGGSVDGGSKG
jgi:hypothetical protein